MTEADWNSSQDPAEMLAFLRDTGKLSERKGRLFAAACCRRIWQHFITPGNWKVVELLERVADDPARTDEFTDACSKAAAFAESEEGRMTEVGCSAAYAVASVAESYPGEHPAWVASRTADCCRNTFYWVSYEAAETAGGAEGVARASGKAAEAAEEAAQATLLRDILGPLPFRPVILPPSVRTWNGGTAARLAQAAYDNRQLPAGTLDQERLMVLADALEDAGCQDQEVFTHLREPGGVHVRGCHVVDLLLGKS